jgi:hypothetical protein
VTEKVAACPAVTDELAGSELIDGGTAFGVTVRTAVLLVTLLAASVTTTSNCAPLSTGFVAGRVYVAEVAPLTGAPFLFHW